jgi:hypothetical protein
VANPRRRKLTRGEAESPGVYNRRNIKNKILDVPFETFFVSFLFIFSSNIF